MTLRKLRGVSQQASVIAARRDQLHAGAACGRQRDDRNARQTERRGVTQDRTARLAVISARDELRDGRARRDQKIMFAQQTIDAIAKHRVQPAQPMDFFGRDGYTPGQPLGNRSFKMRKIPAGIRGMISPASLA